MATRIMRERPDPNNPQKTLRDYLEVWGMGKEVGHKSGKFTTDEGRAFRFPRTQLVVGVFSRLKEGMPDGWRLAQVEVIETDDLHNPHAYLPGAHPLTATKETKPDKKQAAAGGM